MLLGPLLVRLRDCVKCFEELFYRVLQHVGIELSVGKRGRWERKLVEKGDSTDNQHQKAGREDAVVKRSSRNVTDGWI